MSETPSDKSTERSTMRKNRRRSLRRTARRSGKAICYKGPHDMGPDLALSLVDVSETGALLMVKATLERDQEVTLILDSPCFRRPTKFSGTVAWCMPFKPGAYCLGVQFRTSLNYEDLNYLSGR